MVTQSFDTFLSAEEVQISLIRQTNIAKKISRVRTLSQTTIQLSRRAISRANPELSERELNLVFVAYHYGEKIAKRLRVYGTQEAMKTPDMVMADGLVKGPSLNSIERSAN